MYKYRIKEVNGYFFPQKRVLFFWYKSFGYVDSHCEVNFNTLDQAKAFLIQISIKPKYHYINDLEN